LRTSALRADDCAGSIEIRIKDAAVAQFQLVARRCEVLRERHLRSRDAIHLTETVLRDGLERADVGFELCAVTVPRDRSTLVIDVESFKSPAT